MATKRSSPNGHQINRLTGNVVVQNLLLERQLWLRRQLDPRRNIDAECGHPDTIEIDDYKKAFCRGDLATRVVSVFPEESWAERPQVFETQDEVETEFEKAWIELEKRFNLLSILTRADILSGIGRFGIILLGVDDGGPLNQPVAGINDRGDATGTKREILFLRTFDEQSVKVKTLENAVTNPRYGMPKMYEVTLTDVEVGNPTTQEVHWSRVIHLADNRTSSEIYGAPRMEKVFDRLLDIKKIAGGSGEMFWKGGFPGISLEAAITKDENVEFDEAATKEQIEAYMNGLQRYIATVGMQAKSLSVQVADPGPHLEVQVRLVAMSLGIPWRVLVGSEAAQLASEQDIRSWNRRLNRRRQEYVTPFILSPFIQRLVMLGVLPKPKDIIIVWPDLNSPGDKDKAEVGERRTNALMKYVMGGVDALIPPFHFLTLVLGMKDEEAKSIIKEMGDDLMKIDGTAAAGDGSGKNPLGVGTGRLPVQKGRKQPATTAN